MSEPTRQEIIDDLGGITEIARHLGVGIHRMKRWIERRDNIGCPTPVLELAMGHLYSKADWDAWWALWKVTRAHKTYLRKDQLRFPE